MTELKPCPNPWCSSTDIFCSLGRVGDGTEYAVMCPQCRLIGPSAEYEDHAHQSWNTRPLESVNADLLEALLCAYAHVKEIAEGNAHLYQEPRLLQMVKDDLKQIEQAISQAEKSNG